MDDDDLTDLKCIIDEMVYEQEEAQRHMDRCAVMEQEYRALLAQILSERESAA